MHPSVTGNGHGQIKAKLTVKVALLWGRGICTLFLGLLCLLGLRSQFLGALHYDDGGVWCRRAALQQ